MDNFRFSNWKVYKEAKELFSMLLNIFNKLTYNIKTTVGRQLINSGLSIALNIAEGSGKSSDKEFNRFVNISLGSVYETYANIDILHDNKYISDSDFKLVNSKLLSIKNQLGGFKKKLI